MSADDATRADCPQDAPVRVERDGPVTVVTLSRPHARNAVDGPTAHALARAFAGFDADPQARVAVFHGANGHFCAGADLKAMAEESRRNRLAPDGDGPMGPTRMLLSKPVIAAISGYAVAGGLELALWCDLRVVERSAVLGVFCRRFGVPLIDGGTVRLPRLIGLSRAADLLFTGRVVGGEEAERMGFYNRLVDPEQLLGEAQALAQSLAEGPNFGHAMTKTMLWQEWSSGLGECIEAEAQAQAICMQTKDFERAYHAFVAKQKPVFEGN